MLGAVKLEKDFAADFKASNDAVRLDLKVEGLMVDVLRGAMCLERTSSPEDEDMLKMSDASGGYSWTGDSRGCCEAVSEDTEGKTSLGFSFRAEPCRRLTDIGVEGLLQDDKEKSSASKSGREGSATEEIDSLDIEREVMK